MEKTLNKKDGLEQIEGALAQCGAVKATKLAVGLAHVANAVMAQLKIARSQLKNTPAMDAFNAAAEDLRLEMTGKPDAEQAAAYVALRKKHPKAITDTAAWKKKTKEADEMDFEVDLYRIPLTYVPGWSAEDSEDPAEIEKQNAAGVVPLAAMAVFLRFGIFYDPTVEDRDGKLVKAEAETKPPTPIAKAKKK
jgi:hypothetical protein